MDQPFPVVIGLGSNIDAEKNMREAARLLREQWPQIRFSSVYSSEPIGRTDQADFLNAVALIETDREVTKIVDILKSVESALKKNPPHRFGPRTIDLDLLLFGNQVIMQKAPHDPQTKIAVPHLRMHERRFVLEPLIELMGPNHLHPALKRSLGYLMDEIAGQRCERTEIRL